MSTCTKRSPFAIKQGVDARSYFDWLSQKLAIKNQTDWYSLDKSVVKTNNGVHILSHFQDSLPLALTHAYPEKEWHPWKFLQVERDYWFQWKNQRVFLDYLAEHMGIDAIESWYKLKKTDVVKEGGGILTQIYNKNSFVWNILEYVYPHTEWQPWRFEHTIPGFWDDVENQIRYMHWLADQLQMVAWEDLCKVSIYNIQMHTGARKFLEIYGNDVENAIRRLFPDALSRAKSIEDPHQQRAYFDWLAECLQLELPEYWGRVTAAMASEQGRSEVLEHVFGGSIYKGLVSVYPHSSFPIWTFVEKPLEYWNADHVPEELVEWFASKLGLVQSSDWYKLRPSAIQRLLGDSEEAVQLFDEMKPRLIEGLEKIYPGEWQPWIFDSVLPSYWENPAHSRKYFDWLAEMLQISTVDDWYAVKATDVVERCGGSLLMNIHGGSLSRALVSVYTLTDWKPWFVHQNLRVWADVRTQRDFLDWIAGYMGIEDWATVNKAELSARGGSGLLFLYEGSLYKMLSTVYEEVEWQPWIFEDVPQEVWKKEHVQRKFLECLEEQLDIREVDDWYSVKASEVLKIYNGKNLLEIFDNHHSNLVMELYPDTEWQSWRFHPPPPFVWRDASTQRQFLETLAEILQLGQLDDWYRIPKQAIEKMGGHSLLQQFNGLASAVFQNAYPEYNWQPWLFGESPPGYWNSLENQRKFFDWLGKRLHVRELHGWLLVDRNAVLENGGETLLMEHYAGSLNKALLAVYPDEDWRPWMLRAAPKDYWESLDHQRLFFDWLAEQLDIQGVEDWYSLKTNEIVKRGGWGIINGYYSTALEALEALYPDTEWQPWKFEPMPQGLWDNMSIQRAYFDWLGDVLRLSSYEGWYRVKQGDIVAHDGITLLMTYYNGSPSKAITSVYPEFDWKMWLFDGIPKGFWDEEQNVAHYVNWLPVKLGITFEEDWDFVCEKEIRKWKGDALIKQAGGLAAFLEKHYGVSSVSVKRNASKVQERLFREVQKLFPGNQVLMNYRHPHLTYVNSKQQMELDIYLPQHKIAFEYHGEQHYYYSTRHGPPEVMQKKDKEKRDACSNVGITLIEIPCWRSVHIKSIAESVRRLCPTLVIQQ